MSNIRTQFAALALIVTAACGGAGTAVVQPGETEQTRVASETTASERPSPANTDVVETPSASASVGDGDRFTGDWYDQDGEVVSEQSFFKVAANRGPEHCEWQSAIILTVAWPPGTEYDPGASGYGFRQYLRDPDNVIPAVADDDEEGRPRGDLDTDAELPAAADDSGFYTEGAELWFGPDEGDEYAYLVTRDHTEHGRARTHRRAATDYPTHRRTIRRRGAAADWGAVKQLAQERKQA